MCMFVGKRIVNKPSMRLVTKTNVMVQLLCPERELGWIDGRNYGVIYSETGISGRGYTVKTNVLPEGEDYQIMTGQAALYENDQSLKAMIWMKRFLKYSLQTGKILQGDC